LTDEIRRYKSKNMTIKFAQTAEDILKCWAVVSTLRPHLDKENFVSLVQKMQSDGYLLAFVEADEKAMSAVGYRYLEFLFCGQHIYIDDLVTLPEARGKGYAGALLDFVDNEARKAGLKVVTLDSGHHRSDAHRLYLNKGYKISAHHFFKDLG
jgi:GNAT superfamily N-acetyltransferase